MRLRHLSLTNFRNYTRLDIDMPGGPILLVGGNAQGKTSLLEAVYFLSAFVSFHANSDRQLINFFAMREPLAVGRLVGEYTRGQILGVAPALPVSFGTGDHRLEVRIIHDAVDPTSPAHLRKEILLDGVKRKANETIGALNAVLFLPHMLRIIEGSPEERRRYLNLTLSQVNPSYSAALTEYGRTLTQRNALLKQLAERGRDRNGAVGQLDYWDEQLAFFGALLIRTRIAAIQELGRLAGRQHAELTRNNEMLRLEYQPSYDPLPKNNLQYDLSLDTPMDRSGVTQEKIQQGFLQALVQLHREEIARGVTTIGPHRDELRFLANGIDLGLYGSRGQARTAVLSVKLAEVQWMKEKTGQWPVLLLDEVLAELDPQRRMDLLHRLSQCEQALLTTTDLDLFTKDFVQSAQIWHVSNGKVEIKNG